MSRLGEHEYRWTAADPSLRWFLQNARGLDVSIVDISEQVAALALQGQTSAQILRRVADVDVDSMKYFRVGRGAIAGVPVDISRTGHTGDLGYEIWIPWREALRVWDALVEGGRAYALRQAWMLALDVARIEAGLLLIEDDFFSSKRALIGSQNYSPFEMSLGRLVDLDKRGFVGRSALIGERRTGAKRSVVGLEIDWTEVEALYDRVGLAPQVPGAASRAAVPVYSGLWGSQVGKATTTSRSPMLKKLIVLATVASEHGTAGTSLQVEITPSRPSATGFRPRWSRRRSSIRPESPDAATLGARG